MVTNKKNFKQAIHNMDVFRISKLACMHLRNSYVEFTFYGKLTLHEIASFICDVDNQNNISDILRMEEKLKDEIDYVYEEFKGEPCTTIFID